MRPHPVGDLQSVQATHHSPYGLISSEWQRNGANFTWNVTVPNEHHGHALHPGHRYRSGA